MSDRRHTQRPALPEGYQFPSPHPQRPQLRRSVLSPAQWDEIARAQIESMAKALKGINAFNREMAEKWRAPHENAAAQLKRREMVEGATFAPGDRPFIMIGPDCQRTGDETI